MQPAAPLDTTTVRPAQVPLVTLAIAYTRLGITAFGFTVLQQLKSVVLTRQWLTEDEFEEGLAMVQLYPGPMMVDLTAYVGYRLRGVPGALIAALGFILPSFFLMLGLSALYFSFGTVPWVSALFVGLEALVIGILCNITLDLGARNVKSRAQAFIALLGFVGLLLKVNGVLIILLALGLGAWWIRPSTGAKRAIPRARSTRRWVAIGLVIAGVLVVAALAWGLRSEVGTMGLVFFKIGAIAFGNGTTIIPLVAADVVDAYHWLTLNQLADGIALGQITPGPFLITAAFIGYKVGGVFGAALATFAIFSPSIAMTLAFTEVFGRLRDLRIIRGALAGVLASFVGFLVVVILQLGAAALHSPAAIALAAAAFVSTRYFNINVIAIFAGGLVVWTVLLALGIQL